MTSHGVSVRALVVSSALTIVLLVACGYHQNKPGETVCEGIIVNVSTSELHCGKCGNACAKGEFCRDGDCVVPHCFVGEIPCGAAGECVTSNHDLNCGSCGNACDAPRTCLAGECLLPAKMCNGVYRDLNTSRENCGACGHACALAANCYSGTCVCHANVQTDKFNCGSCGNACPDPQKCIDGACL